MGGAQVRSRFALGLQSTINCNNNTCLDGPVQVGSASVMKPNLSQLQSRSICLESFSSVKRRLFVLTKQGPYRRRKGRTYLDAEKISSSRLHCGQWCDHTFPRNIGPPKEGGYSVVLQVCT